MRTFLSWFSRGEVLALVAATAMAGCGGDASIDTSGDDSGVGDSSVGDSSVDAPKDSGVDVATDSAKDTAPDSIADSGHDSTTDSGVDSGVDSADSSVDSIADSGVDSIVDSTPESSVDAADVADTTDTADAAVDTRICTPGTLCSDGTLCVGGTTCSPCTGDGECSAVVSGTLCYGGSCLTGTCHPKTSSSAASGCTTGQACCAATGSAGSCFSPATGGTACCDDTDCTGAKGHCDTTSHTCVCPDPVAGSFFVGSKGSDTAGNGSSACPFQTITHALATAVTAPTTTWTITLTNDSGATSTTYGAGCSGTSCDLTPITIPATFTGGISIVGSGTASQVIVKGGTSSADKEVFLVDAPSAGFTHLTVMPMLTSSTGGADGIVIDAPAAASVEGTISDVVVTGISGTNFTGNAVVVRGGASPRIGPAFVVNGGARGLLVTNGVGASTGASKPTLRSATGAQTTISGTVVACVRVETLAASAGPAPGLTVTSSDASTPVHLTDCGGLGGIVVDVGTTSTSPITVDHVLVSRSVGGAAFRGIHLLNTNSAAIFSNVDITSVGGEGIYVEGSASLTITGAVTSTGNLRGATITGSASATIDGLTASNNTVATESDGLLCNAVASTAAANVKIRNSTFLGNSRMGVFVPAPSGGSVACAVDLGSASDNGNNVFNKSNAMNGGTGLCYASPTPPPASPTASTWSCGRAVGSGCVTPGSPTSASGLFGKQCSFGGATSTPIDFGNQVGSATGDIAIPGGQTCCGN